MSAARPRPPRRRSLRLAFVAAELAPFAQTGGLGEAVAGLARALAARGHAVTCILPAYRAVLEHPALPPLVDAGSAAVALPGRTVTGRWLEGRHGGLRLLLLDLPALFFRTGLYEHADDAERFAAFARLAALHCAVERPDVLVAHDWHAALSICALRTLHDFGAARAIGTVQVVHNNAYPGRFGAAGMAATGLPGELFHPDALEFFGDVCFLKGGLAFADRIVAVSPHHAEELRTPAFGLGLEGLYAFRAARLAGIANGLDTERYDPETDAALPARFGAAYPKPKGACRQDALAAAGLEPPEPGRLLVAVGRLAQQKGWDVLADAIPLLVERGAALALLGAGEPGIAERLRAAALRHPMRVSVTIGFDDAHARRLYAAADQVLVPSRFEPCGLVQLLAQRYGALPVAHRVGGLVDTIEDGATGVLFEPLTPEALAGASDRAAGMIRARGPEAVHKRLLALDVSWAGPAARYEALLAAVAREGERRL